MSNIFDNCTYMYTPRLSALSPCLPASLSLISLQQFLMAGEATDMIGKPVPIHMSLLYQIIDQTFPIFNMKRVKTWVQG